MAPSRSPVSRASLALIISLGLAACSLTPYRYEPLDQFAIADRAVQQESGDLTLRAWVPSVEEAERMFGVPLHQRGIQPVWLEIANHADVRARLIISSIDREYFPPLEVAYLHKKQFSKQGWMDMEAYLHDNAMPRIIPARGRESGFVFTHLTTGTKAFNVDIFHADDRDDYAQFSFFIEVPGFVPDHAEIDFKTLYSSDTVEDLDRDSLRAWISDLPCCTTDRSGVKQGWGIEVFLVSPGRDLLQALLRAGWSETSYERNDAYLDNADYLFGRPPDTVFRKGRDRVIERNELALWMAPVRVDGQPLWVAKLKHPVGRRYEIGERFLTVQLDPDVSEGRNYLLQDFWYAQSLAAYAWSTTGKVVTEDQPERDFRKNEWFADGARLVMWISGPPLDLT
ncbi:MAG: LssY C-terminal domain-containing protein, partial [Gammaproteobacteria bacterium]|nr:LssY C-terminal domain-containing protein [Gammaproteobacteria bacterium]